MHPLSGEASRTGDQSAEARDVTTQHCAAGRQASEASLVEPRRAAVFRARVYN